MHNIELVLPICILSENFVEYLILYRTLSLKGRKEDCYLIFVEWIRKTPKLFGKFRSLAIDSII